MVSKAKLYLQLDRMEDELRERLVPHLRIAASGGNDLVFCTTDFNPFPQLKEIIDTETDALVQLGRQILFLREKLGESSKGSIAERICWYCIAWGDSGDGYQKAVQALASDFLKEIENSAGNLQ